MHRDPYRKWSAQALLCALVFASGCDKLRSLVGSEQKDATDGALAVAQGSARLPEAQPTCSVLDHKVWGKYANRRTGITATRFGERVALGVALGNQPHVLVVEPSGEAKLVRLSAPAGSALAADIPAANGQRDLQRVTPALIAGRITGLADYRDKHNNKRRRIACGPAEAQTTLLSFDGRPRFDIETKAVKKPDAGPAAKPVAAPDAGKTDVASDAAAPAAPAAAPQPSPPAAPVNSDAAAAAAPQMKTAPKPVKKAEREIRDCRSFVDADGTHAWALGSELHGEEQAGKTKWSMRLVALPAQGAEPVLVHSVPLPDEPKEFHTFESPAAEQLRDGSYALAARYRGALFGWTLNASKQRSGPMRVYAGGYPTLVHFVPDGMDYLLLTSQKVQGDRYELRYGRLDGQKPILPSSLFKPAIQGPLSLAEPTLARAGKQRWLAYLGGQRLEGQLMIVPVDHALTAVGRPHALTDGKRNVYESVLLGLTGERVLAVFLQDSDAEAELVSEVLRCSVQI